MSSPEASLEARVDQLESDRDSLFATFVPSTVSSMKRLPGIEATAS